MKKKDFLKSSAAALFCAAFLAAVVSGCDNGLLENPASRQSVRVRTTQYIYDAAEMALIGVPGSGYELDDDYILGANIVLRDWTPIGDGTNKFTGTFDGGNYTITIANFDSDVLAEQYLGIFGYVGSSVEDPSPGYIHDLKVEVKVAQYALKATKAQYVGALVGWADTGVVLENIVVNGDLGYASENRIYLGGIAGYLNGASLTNGPAIAAGTVNISASSPLLVDTGGAVGYGNGASITGVTKSGNVSISNGSVNTSAGGISGYTIGTTITDCHAYGAIDVRLQRPAMIYVGGLAGYAESGTISQSHAEGTVNALSNYPYAGGLVGYNYMGNVISKSYATSNVSASGNNDMDNSYPYAGGLAGYNSGGFTDAPSTIEDCYATGSVSGIGTGDTAWVGGIVGSNAREAIITRTYARGTVTIMTLKDPPVNSPAPGAIAGGIAGYHYFGTPVIENSFALNPSITANVPTSTSAIIHRVVGEKDNTSLIGTNKANSAMVLTPAPAGTDAALDGTDVTIPPDVSEYTALGWQFPSVWVEVSGAYPKLAWQP